ncbi:hypothetical protein [Clostridium minihomine]|uniref:hypothetical protein n=1 Tax=Clostridium minihomine TaxID=2045012 RepID=UPI000C769E34|nr:hypothetical protein [Clostridium minihomine]
MDGNKKTVILSVNKQNEYLPFLTETIDALGEEKVKGLAVVAILEDREVFTGYWNMDLQDKATAETHIRYDCIDQMILNNKDRYFTDSEAEDED